MRSPELTPERVAELLAGATPNDAAELDLLALAGRLRTLEPGAPDGLRTRVAALGEPPAIDRRGPAGWLAGRRGRRSGRRAAFLAAPALAAGLAIVLLAPSGILDGSDSGPRAKQPAAELAARASGGDGAGATAGLEAAPAPSAADAAAVDQAVPGGALPPATEPGRAQELIARTTVGVPTLEDLSSATARAMRQVRDLGGFTVRSDYSVPSGEEGRSELVVKVPTGRVDQALAGFSELGTVLSQEARLRDLTARITRRAGVATRLRGELRALRARAASTPSPELDAQIAAVERRLARALRAERALIARTELATVHLTITSGAEAPETDNQFAAALRRGWDRLSGVLAALLAAAVLLVPIGLLLAAVGAGWRSWRRRERSLVMGRS